MDTGTNLFDRFLKKYTRREAEKHEEEILLSTDAFADHLRDLCISKIRTILLSPQLGSVHERYEDFEGEKKRERAQNKQIVITYINIPVINFTTTST